MQSQATLRHLRIAPRKVRLVAELIQGKKVGNAQSILRTATKSAAAPLEKILRSAIASARHDFQLEEPNLYIARVLVNEGSKLKRYRPRARGRAYPIQKKTSHITMILREIIPSAEKGALAHNQKGVAAGSLSTSKGLNEKKPKFRAAREIQKGKGNRGVTRFFRRKAI